MRKILIGVAVLLVLVIGAVVFTASNLDGLVKTAIETAGTKVAGVPVTVSKVSISIKEGRAGIEGLSVANPKGFTTPTAISLGSVTVSLDPAAAAKSPIEIKTIAIVAPQVTYEISGQGSNLDAIKKNVETFLASTTGGDGGKAKGAEAPKQQADKGGSTLVIDTLTVTQGKVTLATPIPGGAASVKLGDITQKDIGKSTGGASPADIAASLLNTLSGSALKSVSGMGVGQLTDALKNNVGNVGGGALDQVKGLLGK